MTADLRELLVTPESEIALALAALLFGLVVGSFANVVIHRLPERGEAEGDPGDERGLLAAIAAAWARVAHPRRSHCPHCGAAIGARDNVPVLSFLLLGGRCRSCRAPIAWRYPLVEAANGTMWAGLLLVHGPSLRTGVLMLLGTTLLVLALIDLELQLLPDALTLPGTALGLLLAGLASAGVPGWPLPLLGSPSAVAPGPLPVGLLRAFSLLDGAAPAAAFGYSMFWLIAWIWQKHVRPGVEALVQGDWKLAAMLGAFLGSRGLLLTVFLATLAGSLVGVSLMGLRRGDMQSRLPLGTFLGLAGIVVLFCGEPLFAWYTGLFDA